MMSFTSNHDYHYGRLSTNNEGQQQNNNSNTINWKRRKDSNNVSSSSPSWSLSLRRYHMLQVLLRFFLLLGSCLFQVSVKVNAFQSTPPRLLPLVFKKSHVPPSLLRTTTTTFFSSSSSTTNSIIGESNNDKLDLSSSLLVDNNFDIDIDESAVHLRVVHFNDVYKLDHLPKLKGFVDSLKRQPNNNNVICTLGGDFFSPSLLSSIDKGKAMVSCLSSFVDYACLGNHEADHGTQAFQTNVENFMSPKGGKGNTGGGGGGIIINSNFPVMPPPLSESSAEEGGAEMPSSATLTLKSQDLCQERKVTILGLLESSPNLYLPSAFCPGAVENAIPIKECLQQYIQQAQQQQQSTTTATKQEEEEEEDEAEAVVATAEAPVDLILPLTHQDFELDEELAKEYGCPKTMPIILGGHDHDPYDIIVPTTSDTTTTTSTTKCRVLKAGIDAENAIIIDFIWESSSPTGATEDCIIPTTRVQFVDITQLPDSYIDKSLAKKIDQYHAPLRRLDRTVLKVLERRDLALSSENIRKQQTTIGSLICSALRKAMGADVSVMNAGCIRGNSKYTSCLDDDDDEICRATATPENQKFFTFADLLNELPYSTDTCVVQLPGKVLEDMIDYSRNQHGNSGDDDDVEAGGGFLQCCNKMDVVQEPAPSGRYKILQIRGEPFDPHKMYTVATLYHLLRGMDDIKPLMSYVQSVMEPSNLVPHIDSTRPAKELVLQVYYREIWLLLGGFDDIDIDGTGEITKEKLGAALASKFGRVGDDDETDHDEVSSSSSYVDDDFIGDALLAFDSNKDGKVTRAEYDACMLAIKRHRFDLTPTDCVGIVQVMDVVKYLNKRILQEGNKEDKALLKNVVQREVFEAGETILRQGDQGDCLYFCEQGTINFIADGKEVGSCGVGGSFGELSLLYDSPRAACCIASTKCKLWKVDRQAFQFLLVQAANRHNQDVMSVIQYITKALQDPKERIALERILQPKEKNAGEVIIQQGDLGDCLYYCEQGKIQVIVNGEEVGCTTAGGSFGELALLYDTPRAATCLALTDCQLWTVNRPAFHHLLELASSTTASDDDDNNDEQDIQAGEKNPTSNHRELFVSDSSLLGATAFTTTTTTSSTTTTTKNLNSTAMPVVPSK